MTCLRSGDWVRRLPSQLTVQVGLAQSKKEKNSMQKKQKKTKKKQNMTRAGCTLRDAESTPVLNLSRAYTYHCCFNTLFHPGMSRIIYDQNQNLLILRFEELLVMLTLQICNHCKLGITLYLFDLPLDQDRDYSLQKRVCYCLLVSFGTGNQEKIWIRNERIIWQT